MSGKGSQLKVAARAVLDDSILSMAAADELSSPLILLRQLALAISSNTIGEDERKLLGEQLTLTTERALRMVAAISSVTAGQQMMALESINPISICQEVIHELSPLFMAHGQTILLKPRTRMPLLVANRRILQQILLSFADNALQYGSANNPIRMTISGHGSYVRIGVRDYGPAVPIDVWQQIEGRVSRRSPAPIATRPTTSVISLIAARRLAELMNSAVGLIRHRDGATFYVDLHLSTQMSLI